MIRVNVDTAVFNRDVDALIAQTQRAPAIMQTLTRRRMQRAESRIKKRLAVEPESVPDLPFVWSYDPAKQARARRWYFANIVPRGSKGGRYQRTHTLIRAWRIDVQIDDTGGYVSTTNDAPGAEFVIGDKQVPSHYATGWPSATDIDEIILSEAVILEDQIFEDWQTALDPFAGVR